MEIDQETFRANARLMQMREESQAEAQGHRPNISPNLGPAFPTQRYKKISQGLKPLPEGKKRVIYVRGISNGLRHDLRTDIADDLIRRGYAVEEKGE